MLNPTMGRGYERQINGRIVLVNPTPYHRKKIPGLATRQVGFRMQEKYCGYKVRRAKKLVYRLKNQDCKQTVDQEVSPIEDATRLSTTDHRLTQLARLLDITRLTKWARKNNLLAKVVHPGPKLTPTNFGALTDTQFSTTRTLRLPSLLLKFTGPQFYPVTAMSPCIVAVARRRKYHIRALTTALRAGGRHHRSSGKKRIQRDRRETMSEPKKLRRAAAGDALAVQSPDVVTPALVRSPGIVGAALVHNPGAVRVNTPSVVGSALTRSPGAVRRARVHGSGVVGPALVDIPGMVSPASVHSPDVGESALVYRAGGLGWAFTIYEDPVVQEDDVVIERSSPHGETPWRRI